VFLLVPAYPGCPGQKLLNGCVCVCVCTVLFHDPNLLIDCKNFRDLGTFSVDFYCTMLCICGIRYGPVSMSVSVCHKSVLY